jgi:hypothetical protein
MNRVQRVDGFHDPRESADSICHQLTIRATITFVDGI